MKAKKTKRILDITVLLFSIVFLLAVSSCKKDSPAAPDPSGDNGGDSGDNGDEIKAPANRVMVISIDGVSGPVMQDLAPANIMGLKDHSKYSFDVLPGKVSTTEQASWATLLTGVNNAKSLSSSVFSFVSSTQSDYALALVTSWSDLSGDVSGIDYNYSVNSDAAVKDSAVSLLQSVSPLGVMVVDFRGALLAGSSAGTYSPSNSDYKSAIDGIDGYIGDIMDALKGRKNYDKEKWLVIVTTDHGGSPESPKPGFVMCWNPGFSQKEVGVGGYKTVHFSNFHNQVENAVTAHIPDDKGLYNFGSKKDFTIQFRLKLNDETQHWPIILSKTKGMDGNKITGWLFMQSDAHVTWVLGGTDNGGNGKKPLSTGSAPGIDGWVTITATAKYDNGERTGIVYYGDKDWQTQPITGQGSLDSPEPLGLGYGNKSGSGGADFYISGLAIYDIALDKDQISQTLHVKDPLENPFYNDLIGYWDFNEGADSVVYNHAPKGYNMLLGGGYQWESLDPLPPNIDQGSDGAIAERAANADLVPNVLKWLEIPVDDSWGLDGQSWVEK